MRLIRTDNETGKSRSVAGYDQINVYVGREFMLLAARREAETIGGEVRDNGPQQCCEVVLGDKVVATYSQAWPGGRVVVRKGGLKEEYLQRDDSWGDYRSAKRFDNATLAGFKARRVLNGSEDFGTFP